MGNGYNAVTFPCASDIVKENMLLYLQVQVICQQISFTHIFSYILCAVEQTTPITLPQDVEADIESEHWSRLVSVPAQLYV